MQGLQQFLAFTATAKNGGFAAAARELGATPSTLAKSVARLESELSVKLFHRTTRKVMLTPDGERLYARCTRILTEVEDLRADALGTRATPSGLLRINMPVYYGRKFVMPLLVDLVRRFPTLQLDLRFSDKFADLVAENLDLAIRIGTLTDSSLMAKRIDYQHLVLCASAEYLARKGVPRRIEDLADHDAIAFRLPTTGRQRPWQLRHNGAPVELLPNAKIFISDTESLVEGINTNMGICQLPDNVVIDQLASGKIVEVLPSCRPAEMPISVVYQSGRLLPARVRIALEALDILRQRTKARPISPRYPP